MDLELDAKERVYLDSTIPSYYFDEREEIRTFSEITRRWWNERSSVYDLCISEDVLRELSNGTYPNKEKVMEFTLQIPMVERVEEIISAADHYIRHKVMPESLFGDAHHLAYASFYDVEYLMTWNCNHLANANKKKHIQAVNRHLGFSTPQIVTPLELFNN